MRPKNASTSCITSWKQFQLSDDLHTPIILNNALQEALRLMNTHLKRRQQLSVVSSLTELKKEVKVVLDVLGLLAAASTCAEVLQQFKRRVLRRTELTEKDILLAIEERSLARKNKELAGSDQIRSDHSLSMSKVGVRSAYTLPYPDST